MNTGPPPSVNILYEMTSPNDMLKQNLNVWRLPAFISATRSYAWFYINKMEVTIYLHDMMIKSHFCQNDDVLIATQLSQQGFTLHLQNVIACYSITELTQHHTEI